MTMLSPQHERMLVEESGIDPGVVADRGYRSIKNEQELQALRFSREQSRLGTTLVIPTKGVRWGSRAIVFARPAVWDKVRCAIQVLSGNDVARSIVFTHPGWTEVGGESVYHLRRMGHDGAFPLYLAGTSRPRVKFSEVGAWLRSTRVSTSRNAQEPIEGVPIRESGH